MASGRELKSTLDLTPFYHNESKHLGVCSESVEDAVRKSTIEVGTHLSH